MRPRTQIAIPEPKGSEFENFDRLIGMLVKAKPIKPKKSVLKRKKKSTTKA
jgi:hypothetical protein